MADSIRETFPQPVFRLTKSFPSFCNMLQQISFPDSLWEKVDAIDSSTIGHLVDGLEEAAKTLAEQLDITPYQAVLTLVETYFQRFD